MKLTIIINNCHKTSATLSISNKHFDGPSATPAPPAAPTETEDSSTSAPCDAGVPRVLPPPISAKAPCAHDRRRLQRNTAALGSASRVTLDFDGRSHGPVGLPGTEFGLAVAAVMPHLHTEQPSSLATSRSD